MQDVVWIGYRLRAARAWREWSLDALAKEVGCHRSTLSRYECGLIARPSMVVLIVCAEKLGISVPWLFGAECVDATDDAEVNAWLEVACSRLADDRVVKYKRVSV